MGYLVATEEYLVNFGVNSEEKDVEWIQLLQVKKIFCTQKGERTKMNIVIIVLRYHVLAYFLIIRLVREDFFIRLLAKVLITF